MGFPDGNGRENVTDQTALFITWKPKERGWAGVPQFPFEALPR
jgi:hypothetical protein